MSDFYKKAEVLRDDTVNNNSHLLSFVKKIISKWWVFAICGFCGLVIGFIVIRYSTPIYLVTSKILIEDEKKGGGNFNPGDLLGDLSILLNVKSNIDNEIEILKSSGLAEKVVRELNLNITYYREGTFKKNLIYPSPFTVSILGYQDSVQATYFDFNILSEDSAEVSYKEKKTKKERSIKMAFDQPFVISEIGAVKITKNPSVPFDGKVYHFNIKTIDQATAALKKVMTIGVTNKMVSTIDISIDYPIPQEGVDILYKFIQGYMDLNHLEKNRIADSTISFIDKRINLIGSELTDLEQTIQTFKQKNELTDMPEQSRMIVSNTNLNEKELSNISTQISVIDALEKYLSDDSKSKSAVPSSVLLQDVVFNKLSESYNAHLLDRERQLLTSTENNPYIHNLDQRISSLRKAMLSNLATTRKSLSIKMAELQKDLDLLGNQLHQVPANERTFLGLFRQQSLKQELYLFLLKKREEAALSKTSNISSSKIIDYPKCNYIPYKPNGILILALGLMAGMAIPFAAIYILDLFDNRVQGREDIRQVVSLPIIGEFSRVKSGEKIISGDALSLLSEQFRILRSNLGFFFNDQTGISVLVTSGIEGEGKTFTAVNLASIFAITGKKVLLLDLDLRQSSLSSHFGFSNNRGFTDHIISSDSTYAGLIYSSGLNENLFVMPSGSQVKNPSEVMMENKTSQLIKMLKEEYDYIIIDSPAVELYTDALLLSKFVTITVCVVRQNFTNKSELYKLKELSTSERLGKNVGIVLNDVTGNAVKAYSKNKGR